MPNPTIINLKVTSSELKDVLHALDEVLDRMYSMGVDDLGEQRRFKALRGIYGHWSDKFNDANPDTPVDPEPTPMK